MVVWKCVGSVVRLVGFEQLGFRFLSGFMEGG
jgi:hypothetical protein